MPGRGAVGGVSRGVKGPVGVARGGKGPVGVPR